MNYSNVYWTYPGEGSISVGPVFNDIKWDVRNRDLPEMNRLPPNVSGGFIIGEFTLEDPDNVDEVIEYRFSHEHSYLKRPGIGTVKFSGISKGRIQNLKMGHSWNQLENIWEFDNWLSRYPAMELSEGNPITLEFDWSGQIRLS